MSGHRLRLFRHIPFAMAALALAGCSSMPASAPVAATAHPANSGSAAIAVYATKPDGSPLGDALVYARPVGTSLPSASDPPPAVLDILVRHFEPELLVVHAGTTVTLENNDDVSHDVYSFSEARPFSVHLAPGAHQVLPVFARAGVVVVGCKVHGDMLGYIYVTDAPYFGKTDSHGYLRLAGLPPGRYSLGVWRAGDSPLDLPGYPRTLTLAPDSEQVVRVRL